MDQRFMHHWRGAFGKKFVGNDALGASDYEATCRIIDGRNNPIRNIAKFVTPSAEALLFAIPVETAVIKADRASVFAAQV